MAGQSRGVPELLAEHDCQVWPIPRGNGVPRTPWPWPLMMMKADQMGSVASTVSPSLRFPHAPPHPCPLLPPVTTADRHTLLRRTAVLSNPPQADTAERFPGF